MRVLVTGGSGFTGKRVTSLLVNSGHDVAALVRSTSAAQSVKKLGAHPVGGDLDDPRSVDDAFRQAAPEALINVASLGFGHAPTLIGAAEDAGTRRAVFVSSTAIFTKLPTAATKARLDAEEQVQGSDLDWTIVRPTMIYGAPGDRNMSRLLAALRRTPIFPLPGGGMGLQQPVHVDDVAAAIVLCMSTPKASGQAYDLAGPRPLPFRTVVEYAGHAVGRRPLVFTVPLKPLIRVLGMYERTTSTPWLKAEQVARLAEDKTVDISAARRDLQYDPRSFDVGIQAEAVLLGLRAL